jgi:hypothetical protein
MNIHINDLAPMRSVEQDAARTAIELIDRIEAANEIVFTLMLHTCSAKVHPCSMTGKVDALNAELTVIDTIARQLACHF